MNGQKICINKELYDLWLKNTKLILGITGYTQADLAKKCGISRQAISAIMNDRNECHITVIQYLATIFVLREMIEEAEIDHRIKTVAMDFWRELNENSKKRGAA